MEHADSLILNTVAYHDVIVIRYAVEKNGAPDNTSVPEYLVYFQRGVGPVRIEKSQQGMADEVRSLSIQ